MKIKRLLKTKYPHLSQKQIKKLLDNGKVSLGGSLLKSNAVTDADAEVTIPDAYLADKLCPRNGVACSLIKKTDDYIVFHKDPRVHSVALDFLETNSAANWLLSVDSNLGSVSRPLESGLIHRLDYEASGIMLAVRTKHAFEHFLRQWRGQGVVKEYVCEVSSPPPEPGIYVARAVNPGKSSKRVRVMSEKAGGGMDCPIKTQIVSFEKTDDGFHHVVVRLITGFRHQIRVHLAFLGCPIVGDQLYGGVAHNRLCLHASRLEFEDVQGRHVCYEDRNFEC